MTIKFTRILLLLLILAVEAQAQTGTIRGVVVNSNTYERLPFATAYLNYTTLGTSANEKGEFVLKNVPIGQHELIVTFVGHHHYQAKILIKDTTGVSLTIRLKSKDLKEVKINSKRDKQWERQYEKFKKLFLGNGLQATGCEILNPWVLEFKTDNQGFFIATATQALEVENYSLGYKLYYQIKNFKIGSRDYVIGGNVRFQVMETSDTATSNQWKKNRLQVYCGSSRQLFRSIFERTLRDEGFQLYKDDTRSENIVRMANFLSNIGKGISNYSIEQLTYKEVQPNQYQIILPERLEVHYLNKPDEPKIYRNVTHAVSWIEGVDNVILINSDGVVLNPDRLFISGNMGEARIAELLPYDFHPPKEKLLMPRQRAIFVNPVNSLSYLLEKPYLHTDKSYYYPNESVWFKAYMNYGSWILRDSLSQVLYVDLTDSAQNIIMTKVFPINNGFAQGNFVVPSSLSGGDYIIRAYSRWMLNFDAALIFAKPIKVLEYSEVGKAAFIYVPVDTLGGITIKLEKDTFLTREKITITAGVKDFIENFIPANFSISVTDREQVVPAENEKSILKDFAIPRISLPDSLSKDVEYPIQYGIDFSGQFFTKKGRPSQGIITVAQENTAEVFMITTEENGKFYFNNLKLYDSAKLSMLAKTIQGKNGTVIFDSARLTPRIPRVEFLDIQVYHSENPGRYNATAFLESRMLEEVTVRATQLERKPNTIVAPDYVISGDWLRSTNATDIVMALQGKVPGLRVVNGILLLGPPTSFEVGNSAEPLVLIDGVPVNGVSPGNEATAALLSNISPHEIESVEVLKYSHGAAYGSRGANGVISITTRKTNDYQPAGERRYFRKIKITSFSSVNKFSSPDYSIPSDHHSRADYRSTIYWNPNVSTGADNQVQFSFHAADLPTQYRIVIEGITKDRKVVHGEKLITIIEKH